MKFCLRSPLILILLKFIFICVHGENKLGLVEPTETTLIEMKPLFYSFDDSNHGSKMNRLLKKNKKKDSAKHREAYRLFTSDGDNTKETTNDGEAAGDATADGKVIKIDKGLAQLHKEHELDHLDHDSHSGEDKFVKMIWDKGDGFVKRWHWDRGEKVKENHSVAAKKHLEHHDKGKVDEHVEKQSGVVVHSKNDESSETNGIENMAKSSISRDKETKNDDIIEQLKLKLLKQRLQQQQQAEQKGGRLIELDGAKVANNNEDRDSDDVNGDNRIELLLGNQDTNEEADTDDNSNSINDHGVRRQNQYKEIFKKVNNDDKNEDEPRSKARRFPVRKLRNKNEANESNDSESGDNEGNKIKKQRDYHRKVTVREEKSELAAQERYRTGDKNNDETNKESDENNGDEDDNGYESGSKGSGYIKHYQLTSDGQKRSLNPLDFASIIGDQSLQIKTAVAQDNGKMASNANEAKSSENLENTSLARKRLLTRNHFQPNTLQVINPR